MKIYTKAISALVSAVLVLSLAPQLAQAAGYYPSGPQRNVSTSTVTSGGWKLCFSETFEDTNTLVSEMLSSCTGKYILIAGKLDKNSSTIDLLAAGERSAVFKVQTTQNATTLSNGTYFYFYPDYADGSQSIGFSATDLVDNNTCDVENSDAEYRLCRHIDGSGTSSMFDNGYRIGTDRSLNGGSGANALFMVFQSGSVSSNADAAQILAAQQQKQMEEAKSLAVAALGIAAVSNSLSKLTASLLPKTVCVKKGKPNKKVSALKSCPKGYKVKK